MQCLLYEKYEVNSFSTVNFIKNLARRKSLQRSMLSSIAALKTACSTIGNSFCLLDHRRF